MEDADGGGDNQSEIRDTFLNAVSNTEFEEQNGVMIKSVCDSGDSSKPVDQEPQANSVMREQDRFLPIANVSRIMKNTIPEQGKIAKDAKECMQECVSEFISFITSEASDRCQQEKRKTINGEDILFAMSTLGFDNYVEPLKLYLQKYREALKGEKGWSSTEQEAAVASLDELNEDSFSTPQLTANILDADGTATTVQSLYTATIDGSGQTILTSANPVEASGGQQIVYTTTSDFVGVNKIQLG